MIDNIIFKLRKENIMELSQVLDELSALGTERNKKIYISHGAKEPLFGVATGAMKSISKKIKKNQPLAEELYRTGNYDAMYLAGMIADPKLMTKDDFESWINDAYFYMISDYIVAVTLAETDFAQEVADKWIKSKEELKMSAGYNCYSWLLGNRPDSYFDKEKINKMLNQVKETIHNEPDRTKYSMNNFISTVGISYIPLHNEAIKAAKEIGEVKIMVGKTKCSVPIAEEYIQKAIDKGKIGFKRKNVRC